MQKNTSVSLGSHFDEFITQQISSGRYGSASDVIRSGLRLLEEKEAKISLLHQALIDGENSGMANYSLESLKQELDEEI